MRLLLTGIAIMCMASFATWATPPDSINFGTINLTLNDLPPEAYRVKSAKLYRKVSIGYDEMMQLHSSADKKHYFYAQFSEGESTVLHLLLDTGNKQLNPQLSNLYDIYIDLGKDFSDTAEMSERDSAVFIFPGGRFPQVEAYGKALAGIISVSDPQGRYGVNGSINAVFEFPGGNDAGSVDKYRLNGELSIPSENLISGGKTGFVATRNKRGQFTRNLLIGALLAGLIVAAVLLPE